MKGSYRKIYYGWWIVAATMVLQLIAFGTTIFSFGLFIKPVAESLDLSRATLTNGVVLWMIGQTASSPLLGKVVDRRSPRFVMVFSAILLVMGLAWISVAQSTLEMAIAAVLLLGPGTAGLGPLSCSKLVAHWFTRRRARAMGISMIGGSAGGVVVLPILTQLIEQYHWREVLRFEAIATAVILSLVIALVVRNTPQEIGLETEAEATSGGAEEDTGEHMIWDFARLMRERNYWMMVLAMGMIAAIAQALVPTLIPYATDAGIELKKASLLVTLFSMGALSGKVVAGYLGDHMDKRHLLVIIYSVVFGYMVLLQLYPGYNWLAPGTLLGGLAIGGMAPLVNTLLVEFYGARSFGTVYGTLMPFVFILSMAAVGATGYVYDNYGNYTVAFQGFLVASVIGGISIMLARPNQNSLN